MLNENLFVSNLPQERKIKLPDGTEATLYFKELPAIELTRYWAEASSNDAEVKLQATPKLLAAALCDAEGKTLFTAEQIAKLKNSVLPLILAAFQDVNGLGEEKKD